ncbi:MAG: hypothetical protein SGILL_006219 [Bacillariaceae sp.]
MAMASHASHRTPSEAEMKAVFVMCRKNQWRSVLNSVRSCGQIGTTSMTMQNHIATTVLHQAITSKGDTKLRALVVEAILDVTPWAAKVKNGYGSLPLHVVAQRNTKMNSATKDKIIRKLVKAFPGALLEPGGVGKRTPIHIIFTGTSLFFENCKVVVLAVVSSFVPLLSCLVDYISPTLTEELLQMAKKACFMRDSKGFLPIHIACSRHASPHKIAMLLDINPASLHATTDDGQSCLALAENLATKSHPNYALIDDLRKRLRATGSVIPDYPAPTRVSSNETSEGSIASRGMGSIKTTKRRKSTKQPRKRKRKVTADDDVNAMLADDTEQANLLLSLSRQTPDIQNFASV